MTRKVLTAGLLLVATAQCRGTASDRRPWRASDHDRSDEPVAPAAQSAEPVVANAWRTRCAPCHGLTGRGDGPRGPDVRASDLSRSEWQDKTTDAQMAAVISTGRGMMPRFNLPPDVVDGLVKHIRSLRRR